MIVCPLPIFVLLFKLCSDGFACISVDLRPLEDAVVPAVAEMATIHNRTAIFIGIGGVILCRHEVK